MFQQGVFVRFSIEFKVRFSKIISCTNLLQPMIAFLKVQNTNELFQGIDNKVSVGW